VSDGLHTLIVDAQVYMPTSMFIFLIARSVDSEFASVDETYGVILADLHTPSPDCCLLTSVFDQNIVMGQLHIPECPLTQSVAAQAHNPAGDDVFEFEFCHAFTKEGWKGAFVSLPLPIPGDPEHARSPLMFRGVGPSRLN